MKISVAKKLINAGHLDLAQHLLVTALTVDSAARRSISIETTIDALKDAGIRVWTKAGLDDVRIYDPRKRGGYLVLEQVYSGDLSYYQAEVAKKVTGAFRAQVARVLDELRKAHS